MNAEEAHTVYGWEDVTTSSRTDDESYSAKVYIAVKPIP